MLSKCAIFIFDWCFSAVLILINLFFFFKSALVCSYVVIQPRLILTLLLTEAVAHADTEPLYQTNILINLLDWTFAVELFFFTGCLFICFCNVVYANQDE